MKRVIALLSAAFMLLSLTACGSDKSKDKSDAFTASNLTEAPASGTMLRQYREAYYPFPGGYTVSGIARVENTVLMLGSGEDEQRLALAYYEAAPGGRVSLSEARMLALDALFSGNDVFIYDITAGNDGMFYILVGNLYADSTAYLPSGGNAPVDLTILSCSPDGALQERKDIPAYTPRISSRLSLTVEDKSNLVLSSNGSAAKVNWSDGTYEEIDLDGRELTSASLCSDGIVLSVLKKVVDSTSPYYLVDKSSPGISELKLSNPYDPTVDYEKYTEINGGSWASCQGLAGEYISVQSKELLLVDFANDSVTELLQWNYEFIPDYDIGEVCRLSNDSYLLIPAGILTVIGNEAVPYEQTDTVSVALIGIDEAVIADANSKYLGYTYVATSFDEENSSQFITELSAGKTYDLVLFSDCIDTSSDYYEDLLPYIDASDSLGRESFLPNLLESMTINGELHQLWDQASVNTFASRKAYVGERTDLTLNDCLEIISSSTEPCSLFDPRMTKADLLRWAANIGAESFVDKNNAVCTFDSQKFADLLMAVNLFGNDSGGAESAGYSEYGVMLYPYPLVNTNYKDLRDYIGDDLVFLGFPDGVCGFNYYEFPNSGFLTNCVSMAIPKSSQNKEGAWAFINQRLSMENQMKIAGTGMSLPVIMSALEKAAAGSKNGEDWKTFCDLVSRTKYAAVYDDAAIRDIIMSSAEGYLNGDRALDDVVKSIQSKAAIYVSEQYG